MVELDRIICGDCREEMKRFPDNQSAEYCEIARKRIAAVPRRLDSFFQQPPEEDARP